MDILHTFDEWLKLWENMRLTTMVFGLLAGVLACVVRIERASSQEDWQTFRNVRDYIEHIKVWNQAEKLTDEREHSTGLVVGPWFIAWFTESYIGMHGNLVSYVTVLTPRWQSSIAISAKRKKASTKPYIEKMVNLSSRHEPDWHVQKRISKVRASNARDWQRAVVDRIERMAAVSHASNYSRGLRVLVSGPAGFGKSTIATLVALRYGIQNTVLCDTFDPTKPGHIMNDMWMNVGDGQMLVVSMDEVEHCVLFDEQTESGEFCCEVTNRKSWNTFMDNLDTIDDLIVVMTTNKRIDDLLDQDKSMFRLGRVDLFVALYRGDGSLVNHVGDQCKAAMRDRFGTSEFLMQFGLSEHAGEEVDDGQESNADAPGTPPFEDCYCE